MLRNFSFLVEKSLAGCAMPGAAGSVMNDLAQAREEGITALVTLTEEPLLRAMVEESGLRYLHLPVSDFHAPTMDQVQEFIELVNEVRGEGGAVLVHCFAGYGRTGTFLAAYLISQGHTPESAIREVRRRRPGSIESDSQVELLREVGRRFRGRKAGE